MRLGSVTVAVTVAVGARGCVAAISGETGRGLKTPRWPRE
jgi:hypothetical protein